MHPSVSQPIAPRATEQPSRLSAVPTGTGASVLDATIRLQAARDLGEFTEVFEQTLGDDHGALARLHQFLETAATWCREHDAHHSATELNTLGARLADLAEELQLLPDELHADVSQQQARTAVAQAALRTSPTAAARPTPTVAGAPAPGARCRRVTARSPASPKPPTGSLK